MKRCLATAASCVRLRWPGLYYPQAPDIASAAPIRVTSGQQVQADMVMSLVPVYTVSGLVAGFLPGKGVSVQVQNSSGDSVSAGIGFHEATGEFAVHLPAGSYRLKAFSQASEQQQLRSDVHITVEKDLTQLQMALQPALSIPVHARMEDRAQDAGQAASSRGFVPARGTNEAPPVSVHLISSDPGGSDVYSINSSTQGNRTLSLRSIEPGRYTADISPYGGWYVESAQCGNANLLSEDLVVSAGTSCTLELSLRNDGGTLRAQVEGSKSAGSGMALLVPARGRRAPRSVAFYSSDPSSPPQVTLSGIVPGDYLLYAFDSPEGVEYSTSDASYGLVLFPGYSGDNKPGADDKGIHPIDPNRDGCRVTVRRLIFTLVALSWTLPFGPGSLAAAAAQSYPVAGVLLDSVSSQPLPGFEVTLTPDKGGSGQTVRTSARGQFSFPAVPAGKYIISGSGQGYRAQGLNQHDNYFTGIAVGPKLDATNIIFGLQPDAVIRGQVLDEQNEPVRNATAQLFRMDEVDGVRRPVSVTNAGTNDQGYYHFSHLGPGTYYVALSARPWYAQYSPKDLYRSQDQPFDSEIAARSQQEADQLDVAYPLTFYPEADDSSQATAITLHQGERFTADVVMRAVPGVHLKIRSDR